MFEFILPAAVGALGSIIGGQQRNNAQAQQATQANEFSAQQFATRYQTTVQDMQAAGLNPMLAYSQGGGSPPTGQQAQMQDVLTPGIQAGVNAYSAASANAVQRAQVDKVKAETENVEADTKNKHMVPYLTMAQTAQAGASADHSRAGINTLEWQAKKISEEIKNIPKEGDRLDALAKNLAEHSKLMQAQGVTQVAQTEQLKMLALRTLYEADLTKLDLDANLKFDNMSKEFSQLKPIFDFLKMFIGRGRP